MAATPTTLPDVTATSSPVALPEGKTIIFDDSGDKDLTGTLYGHGETAVLLANMSIGGEAQWDPFVAAVDKEKFTTVTFTYRNFNNPGEDIRLVLQKLREEGFERILCIGASMGTGVCSTIAREPEMVGLVLIAGSVNQATVAEITYPKLFISAASDPLVYDIKTGFEKAAEPKTLAILEDARAHGTNLFQSSESDNFLTLLIDFVNALAE
jgi:dienelactone hydrolase